MNLHNLVEKYGTDKNASGYTIFYESLFKKYYDKFDNILEIGIGSIVPNIPSSFHVNLFNRPHYTPGGSLRVWRDFVVNSNVYGVDIDENCMFEEERIKTILCDSRNKKCLDLNLNNLFFDLIIDDGLHEYDSQKDTFKNLYFRLKENGFYIIEDIDSIRNPMFKENYKDEIIKNLKNGLYYYKNNIFILQNTVNEIKEVESIKQFK